MKNKILFIFLWITSISFSSYEKLSNIKNLSAVIEEIVYVNGESKEKKYQIEYISNDYLRKEMLSPKINKGEIFQFENNKSLVYIPIFDEISEYENEDVSNFLTIINELKNKDKNNKEFSRRYYLKQMLEITDKNNYAINIKKYQKIKNYLLPLEIEIKDNVAIISKIILKDVEINTSLNRKGLKK